MTVLGRIVKALLGYALACVAASLVLAIGGFAPDWNELTTRLGMDSAAAQSVALWWISGIAAINSGAYYVLKGIVIWSFGPGSFPHPVPELLCMAGGGLFAGVMYWLMVGRKLGRAATSG